MLAVSEELGVPAPEVSRAVRSFFGAIVRESRSLPFDNGRKIFTKEKFAEFGGVTNIPRIGRMGPVYSRYLKWRGNEARNTVQASRSGYRSAITQDEIERMAGEILSGKAPSPVIRRKGSDLFDRVWVVGKDGKKSARQVIPKEPK